MATTKRDRIELSVLAVIFAVLMIVLYVVFRDPSGSSFKPENSGIIRQRMINLQKGK